MPTVTARYLGDLRLECRHEASGARIFTDAPVDNHGKGEGFSPTDLCATALGACAMTIMGIWAAERGIDLANATLDITKIMAADPRRIARIEVIFNLPAQTSDADQKQLETLAKNCPVCKSLASHVEQIFKFNWIN